MTDKTRVPVSCKHKRRLSSETRQRMRRGAQNLAQWRLRADTRANQLEAEVNAFRANLLTELGANPSAKRLAVVEAVTASYAAICRLRHAVIRAPRSEVQSLSERISWLSGNVDRLLKGLELPPKPRPKTLADINLGPTTGKP